MPVGRNRAIETYGDLRDRIVAERPDVREALARTKVKRALASALVGLRKSAGLTQSALAAKADWDKAFVSRLESATGGLPELDTLARYVSICGADVRLSFEGLEQPVEVRLTDDVEIAEEAEAVATSVAAY